jgi:hypothetical protein
MPGPGAGRERAKINAGWNYMISRRSNFVAARLDRTENRRKIHCKTPAISIQGMPAEYEPPETWRIKHAAGTGGAE